MLSNLGNFGNFKMEGLEGSKEPSYLPPYCDLLFCLFRLKCLNSRNSQTEKFQNQNFKFGTNQPLMNTNLDAKFEVYRMMSSGE